MISALTLAVLFVVGAANAEALARNSP